VATFASLSLKRRATAALNVIDANPGLSIAERSELVYVALWPGDIVSPGPVRRDDLVIPDVDLRPTPRRVPPSPRTVVPPRVATVEDRARARERFLGGTTIAELAEEFGVPWLTARRWANSRS
jgi:hypothetical protein